MTKIQRCVLGRVAAATLAGVWYRADGNGERVTLASLWRCGVLKRRAWRGVEGKADAAHEYMWGDEALAILKKTVSP